MKKLPKQEYTAEFKEQAVAQVASGRGWACLSRRCGIGKAARAGKLAGAGTKSVTPEQMELSRLRAENLRLKREMEIVKNHPTRRHTVPLMNAR